jgi:hypothetical protein
VLRSEEDSPPSAADCVDDVRALVSSSLLSLRAEEDVVAEAEDVTVSCCSSSSSSTKVDVGFGSSAKVEESGRPLLEVFETSTEVSLSSIVDTGELSTTAVDSAVDSAVEEVIISLSMAVEASSSVVKVVVTAPALDTSSSDEESVGISPMVSPEVGVDPSSAVTVGESEVSSVVTSLGTEMNSEVVVAESISVDAAVVVASFVDETGETASSEKLSMEVSVSSDGVDKAGADASVVASPFTSTAEVEAALGVSVVSSSSSTELGMDVYVPLSSKSVEEVPGPLSEVD